MVPGPHATGESVDDDLVVAVTVDVSHRRCRPIPVRSEQATGGFGPSRRIGTVLPVGVYQVVVVAVLADDHLGTGHPVQVRQDDAGGTEGRRLIGHGAVGLAVTVAVHELGTVGMPDVNILGAYHDLVAARSIHIAHREMAAGLQTEALGEGLQFRRLGRLAGHQGGSAFHQTRIECRDPVVVHGHLVQAGIHEVGRPPQHVGIDAYEGTELRRSPVDVVADG